MTVPAVSVLMTVYNAGRFLLPAVEGLLGQSFGDFELVAIENGSTDGSVEVMRSLAARDGRIRLIEMERNIGRTPALILALDAAQGGFVAVQDADDISLSNRFECQVAYLRAHDSCQLLGTWCGLIDENDVRIGDFHPAGGPDEAFQAMAHTNVVAHSSAMYRRASALAAGGYPADLPFSQDYGLWVRLMARGGIAVLEEELAAIRQHGGNLTASPATVTVRSLDAIKVFRQAARLPGLSAATLAENRRVEAWECGRLAEMLMRQGRWPEGLAWAWRGLARDPASFAAKALRRMGGGVPGMAQPS